MTGVEVSQNKATAISETFYMSYKKREYTLKYEVDASYKILGKSNLPEA